MKHYAFTDRFRALYDKAGKLYASGNKFQVVMDKDDRQKRLIDFTVP